MDVDWDSSIQGKSLISRQCRYICACIAALAAANRDRRVSQILSTFMDPSSFENSDDKDDIDYQNMLVQVVSGNLCSLSCTMHHTVHVRANWERILMHLVDLFLGIDILDKFPTCNLARVKENSGSFGEEKESSRLIAINSLQSQNSLGGKLRHLGEEVWEFSANFSRALTMQDTNNDGRHSNNAITSKFAGALQSSSNIQLEPLEDFRSSMELECLKRIKASQSIIDVLAAEEAYRPLFQRTCSHALRKSASELVIISKRWDVLERSYDAAEDDVTMHKCAKMLELVSSYTEIHITLLLRILIATPQNVSGEYSNLMKCIRERYLPSVIRGVEKDVTSAILEIVELSRRIQGAQRGNHGNTLTDRNSKVSRGVVSALRESAIRRSRELAIYISGLPEQAPSLVKALLDAAVGKVPQSTPSEFIAFPDLIGQAFAFTSRKSYSTGDVLAIRRSPLQQAIDADVKRDRLFEGGWELLKTFKKNFLSESLQRLMRRWTDKLEKKNLVRLLQCMIEGDTWDLRSENTHAILRDLAKGLSESLRAALESDQVESSLVFAIMACAKSLAVSPMIDSGERSLAKWSSDIFSHESTSGNDLIAAYVWSTLLWFKFVAETIVDHGKSGSTTLEELRNKLRAPGSCLWPLEARSESERHRDLMSRLFPERGRSTNIVNIYASKTNQKVTTLIEKWRPEANVCRVAKEYMAEIIPLAV
jgi:hypothetical protein